MTNMHFYFFTNPLTFLHFFFLSEFALSPCSDANVFVYLNVNETYGNPLSILFLSCSQMTLGNQSQHRFLEFDLFLGFPRMVIFILNPICNICVGIIQMISTSDSLSQTNGFERSIHAVGIIQIRFPNPDKSI